MQKQHELNETILSKQHQLNLAITKIQTKTVWRATFFGAICAILGALAGAYLTVALSQHPSVNLLQHRTQDKQESFQSNVLSQKEEQQPSQGQNMIEESQNNKMENEVSKQPPTDKKENKDKNP